MPPFRRILFLLTLILPMATSCVYFLFKFAKLIIRYRLRCSMYSNYCKTKRFKVTSKPPYVCNGCRELPKCTLLKHIYDPADAHEMAHKTISESRTGILSNEDDIAISCQGTDENPGFSFTKRESRLQMGNLVYKTRISFTKWDSWSTNGTLGLPFTPI